MAETPPNNTRPSYSIPIPHLPSRAHQQRQQSIRVHPRQSLLSQSSFSLGPQPLVNSLATNGAPTGRGLGFAAEAIDFQKYHSDPNASVMSASPRQKRTIRVATGQDQQRSRHPRNSLVSGASSISSYTAPLHPLAFDSARQSHETQITATELDEGEVEGDEEEEDWGIVDRMRLWRHDAMMQHLHGSAIFWGDKVLSLTGDQNDAFWLAQAHFLNQNYARAEQLLTRPFVIPDRPFDRKGKGREELRASNSTVTPGLGLRGPSNVMGPPPATGFFGGIEVDANAPAGAVSKLVDMSVACRYLAAQCMVRSGKWAEAVETLGESNPWRGTGVSGPGIPNCDGGIKVEASMCYLRGVLMMRLNRQDKAREHFMEALALDVKCFDAFEELVGGQLLAADEEWDFVQGLQFMQQVPEDADFVRLVYTIRLKKEKNIPEMALARQRLVEDYDMRENPDVLFAFAESFYAQYRWEDAFVITSRIQQLVGLHSAALPTHIACMNNLRHLHPRLFLLAHELVDKDPENPVSWYAVGVYYLLTRKYLDARKFFSKANLMDPRFGPAWIGFAHSYSYEGEHDHAIVAYSTAARLFPGLHLPALFLGMEHLQINNFSLASEYLALSLSICDGDPLLFNEIGVLAFQAKKYQEAADRLERAIELTGNMQGTDAIWATTYLNLGQAYRKLGRLDHALKAFRKVIELNPRHAQGFACIGLIHHMLEEYEEAIRFYHDSLSIDPIDANTIDLLNFALETNAEMPAANLGVIGLPGGEALWEKTVAERQVANAGRPPVDELGSVARARADTSMDGDVSSMEVA
ncbi:anaphase promoting complex subunit cdc16 [Tulasnella sp. JGI-2019a]|nr:anaphase promoting complex subunit cdc16 [Tulasnella sp. JGI-2019a]